jgi:hypothetical protein
MKAAEEEKEKRDLKAVGTRPLAFRNKPQLAPASAKSQLKEVQASEDIAKAAAVPLPPSPQAVPAGIPLPPSRSGTPSSAIITAEVEHTLDEVGGHDPASGAGDLEARQHTELAEIGTSTPQRSSWTNSAVRDIGKTPISSLVSAIQRGFLNTPNSPLSPPSAYAGSGEPWTGWPADMGPFAQMLPVTKDEVEAKEVVSPSPRADVKWLTGLTPEEDSFYRPALAQMDMN